LMPANVRFVQFPHPGREHRADEGTKKAWNPSTKSHARKFLELDGHYLSGRGKSVQQGTVWAWGEWEPESEIVKQLKRERPGDPARVFRPYWIPKSEYSGLHNTDPFIYGGFFYGNCKQNAQPGLRDLDAGSMIVFGSGRAGEFVADTVLVVKSYLDFDRHSYKSVTSSIVPAAYEYVFMMPTFASGTDAWYRLYVGATIDDPLDGMFSFFPCAPAGDERGFPRPPIVLPGYVNPKSFQAPGGAGRSGSAIDPSVVRNLWVSVRDQVLERGLALGVEAKVPPRRQYGAPSNSV
jgi:hypothetical protein